jgi:3-oxoacyl-ACP reductase-like protein
MNKSIVIGCICVTSLLGCQKKAEEQIPPPAAPASAAPAPSASVTPAPEPVAAVASSEVSATSVPVEEDFEKKATATVTKPTLKQQVDKLEQEIGK